MIFQRGGVDGLNVVIPYREGAYYASRPTISVPPPGHTGGAIDLDGFFGLHPALSPLAPLYARRRLAIVHACGLANAPGSHLRAQDAVESLLAQVEASCPVSLTRIDSWTWDHHAGQGGSRGLLADGLRALAKQIRSVADDAEASGEDTVIVAISEFGRTVAENASGGTDHGRATVMLVAGNGIDGGRVHGKWPGLQSDQQDVPITTEIRDVLMALAGRVARIGTP